MCMRVCGSKVMVVGAGVAGLAAIQQAKNLNAVVTAFDVRAAAKEQVRYFPYLNLDCFILLFFSFLLITFEIPGAPLRNRFFILFV